MGGRRGKPENLICRRIAALAFLALTSNWPSRASSIHADAEFSSPGNSFYSFESSVVSLADDFSGRAFGGLSLYSGYLNFWYVPSGAPSYGLLPATSTLTISQVASENTESQMFAVLASFLPGVALQRPALAQLAASPQLNSTAQVLAVQAAEVPWGNVPEPSPATLVFLGCCVVAISLALANRGVGDPGAQQNSGGVSWPKV